MRCLCRETKLIDIMSDEMTAKGARMKSMADLFLKEIGFFGNQVKSKHCISLIHRIAAKKGFLFS